MTHHIETHKANTETRKRVFVSHGQVLPKTGLLYQREIRLPLKSSFPAA